MRSHPIPFWLTLLLCSLASTVVLGQTIRVPDDASLEQALRSVADGGVIEVAAGVYPAPTGGFRVGNLRKDFTVRAVPGAEVILDGGGVEQVVVLQVQEGNPARRVSFEGLTFRNGFSSASNRSAGLTLDGADGDVVGCRFEANEGDATSGAGAILVRRGGRLRVTASRFEGNVSRDRGAGIAAIESTVDVVGSLFVENRINVDGHSPVSPGGAIYVLDSALAVVRSRFEGNEAGWVGGAVYGFGRFREPGAPLATSILVDDVTFVANRAAPGPCCSAAGVPGGGAIHVEDATSLVVRHSRFRDNAATWGGAVSGFRAVIEIEDSELVDHRLDVPDSAAEAGGAVNVTGLGPTPQGYSSRLTLRRSFLRGGNDTARQGGCLFAAASGADRGPVRLEEVVFEDCRAVSKAGGSGLGGALFVNHVDLDVERTLFFGSLAVGNGAAGGALFALGGSSVSVVDSTFARSSAENFGGAVQFSGGGELEILGSTFLENVADSGTRGSALAAILPTDETTDLLGVVSDSLFSGNVGVEIVEVDNVSGGVNRLRYDGNRFDVDFAGEGVFQNTAVGGPVRSVSQLNGLIVPHSGGSADKSQVANQQLLSPPSTATLLAVPSALPGAAPSTGGLPSTHLAYAWTGNAAQLAGDALSERAGVTESAVARRYRLTVDGGASSSAARVTSLPCSRDGLLCLDDDRFLVQADWLDFQGVNGGGSVVPGGSSDSGLFWFFAPDNWEMLVKVLDGCGLNGHFWVFLAATTNVEYTLRVTDTVTGRSSRYRNPLGNAANAIADTGALPVCDGMATATSPSRGSAAVAGAGQKIGVRGLCAEGETGICLNASRFRVEVDWRDFEDRRGSGRVVPLRSDDSGLFWFFDADNWEMLVKVLDGCSVNGHFWVFLAATTNVEYTLRVTDTTSGEVREYTNPLGTEAPAVTDTGAFPTCP